MYKYMMESQPGVLWNLSIALNALKLSIHWRLPLRLSGKKKNNSADICCNEANDLTSFFWLALGPTLQNQQTKQHCKPSGPVASHPHYVQKDLSKTIQSFLGRSRSFAEETTLPTFTLRFFSSPSITFPLMHEVSPNQ